MALRFFRSRLDTSWVPAYLGLRGFPKDVHDQWQAGHAPAGWDTLIRYLHSLGVPAPLIEGAGLARRSRRGTLIDVFRDRAILPIRSPDGQVAAFIGRSAEGVEPGVPKYVNSPRTCLYDKSAALFGLWEARSALARGARPVIVEGPFDAIAVTSAGAGQFAGIAPCGVALTAGQIAALAEVVDVARSGAIVAFDPDQAGLRAAVRAYHLLGTVTSKTVAASMPAGHDPAQMFARGGPAALATVLSRTRPLADLVVDVELNRWHRWLDKAEGRANALHAAAPVVAAMPVDHVARQVARLAEHLGIDHAAVTEAVTEAIPRVLARRDRGNTAAAGNDLPGAGHPVTFARHAAIGPCRVTRPAQESSAMTRRRGLT